MSGSTQNKRKSSEGAGSKISGTTVSEKEKVYLGEYHGRRTYEGQRHGYAWCILPNSDIYVGNYDNGMRHGKGLYIFKDGSRYNGFWKNNCKDGVGKMVYPDGSYYQGDWKHNARHGFGSYYYSNGDLYEGNWKNGKRHGLGTYAFTNLNVLVKCIWYDGIQNGSGKILYPFFTFCGSWMEGVGEGKGLYTFYSKCILEGIHLVNKQESQKSISIVENQSEIHSQSQYMEPEDALITQAEGATEDNIDYIKPLTSSEMAPKESNVSVEWIPLRVLRYDVNLLPPEPTYDTQSLLSQDILPGSERSKVSSMNETLVSGVEYNSIKLSSINEGQEVSNFSVSESP